MPSAMPSISVWKRTDFSNEPDVYNAQGAKLKASAGVDGTPCAFLKKKQSFRSKGLWVINPDPGCSKLEISFDARTAGYTNNQGFRIQAKFKTPNSNQQRWVRKNKEADFPTPEEGWKRLSRTFNAGNSKKVFIVFKSHGNSNSKKVWIDNVDVDCIEGDSDSNSLTVEENPTVPEQPPIVDGVIINENFDGKNVRDYYTKLDDKLGNFGSGGTMGVKLSKVQSLRNEYWLNITDCPNHMISNTESKQIHFTFSVMPSGYENGEGFTLDTLQHTSKKWNLVKKWETDELNMGEWQQVGSPPVYFPSHRMKFRIRSFGNNETKMISLDDLNIICD